MKYQFEVDFTTNHDYTYQEAEAFKVPASPEMNTVLSRLLDLVEPKFGK